MAGSCTIEIGNTLMYHDRWILQVFKPQHPYSHLLNVLGSLTYTFIIVGCLTFVNGIPQ
jgi:hypothetical protein